MSLPSSAPPAKYVVLLFGYSSKKAGELIACFGEWKKQTKKVKIQTEDIQ
jgi:hypothetical protein